MINLKTLLLIFICLPAMVCADILVANRTLRAQTILTEQDVSVIPGDVPGALISAAEAVGLETRVAIYSGRAIMAGDVGAAAIIERNQIVKLTYQVNGLRISADARALGRAGPGDFVRVMNLNSKATVSGMVALDGSVRVGAIPET